MGIKRRRQPDSNDPTNPDNDRDAHDDNDDEVPKKRPKHEEDDRDHLLWPPATFHLTYLAWARRQFPTTGFCIDFRAQWLKSRH